jgi:hypothetical protein
MPSHKSGASYYVPITLKGSYIAESSSHRRLYIPLAGISNATWWALVSARSKLAVVDAATGAALPAHVGVALNNSAKIGCLQFDAAVTAGQDKTFWLDVGAGLSEVNAAASVTNENGFMSYDFEESTSPFPDAAGNYSGTAASMAGYQQAGKLCAKCAASFVNTNALVNAGNTTQVNNANKLTLSVLLKQNYASTQQYIFSKSSTYVFGAITHPNGNLYVFWSDTVASGNLALASYQTYMPLGSYHHLALAYDGTQTGDDNRLKLYVDGALMTVTHTRPVPASITSEAISFYIGNVADGSYPFNGSIDQFDLFTDTKSSDWVTTTYNNYFMADFWAIGAGAAISSGTPTRRGTFSMSSFRMGFR